MAYFLGKVYFSTQIGVVGWTRGLVMSFEQILNLYNYIIIPLLLELCFIKPQKPQETKQ